MLSFEGVRKMLANALVSRALDVAVLCDADAEEAAKFVDEVIGILLETMPEDTDVQIYFEHFAEGLTDGFAYEYVVEHEADQDLARELIDDGVLDGVAENCRFKAACYIVDMDDLEEFPDSYEMEDKVAAAAAYADGYEIGQQKYSYRETWFGEPAMYIDSRAVTSALVAIAG